MSDYSPRALFERSLTSWWLIVLLAILGGMAGWSFHLVRPPVYEASARINLNINYNQTGLISEIDQDKAYNAIGALIQSSGVIAAAVEQAGARPEAAVLNQTAFVQRLGTYWEMRVRDRDPQAAADLANAWADEAYRQLTEALGHAVRLGELQAQLTDLERCLQRSVAAPPGYAGCTLADTGTILAQIDALSAPIAAEKVASRGLISAIGFDLSQRATPPARPVALAANWLALAGTLIGLVAGLWAAGAGLGERIAGARRHA